MLTVSAERHWDSEDQAVIANERPQGTFSRQLLLGDNLDAASVRISRQLIEHGICAAGAAVVFVSVNADLSRGDANYLKIQRL